MTNGKLNIRKKLVWSSFRHLKTPTKASFNN
jgi:hypothetical protein